MNYSVPSIVLLFAAFNAFAADPNGYNATYEIEIGTPPACDVTITSADSSFTIESALNNPLNTVICADAGDYTAKGKITITDSGSVGNEKWWRLSGPATKHPIDLMASERAIFETVGLQGNYWIIHRLYFDANGTSPGNFISGTNNILDRIVMERRRWK